MPLSMEKKLTETVEVASDPKVYEVGFHIVSSVAEDDLGVRVTAIRDVIESAGGRMIADEFPKHCELAYPMVKVAANKRATYNSSYFGWMKFDAEASGIKKVEAALKADAFVLRFIIVKTVRENTMAPKKALMQKRGEEVERPVAPKVEDKPALTEEELDKTIEDLVIS